MKDEFDIAGLFYKDGKYKCRKYLDIKYKGSKLKTPDLMVIMMNPGSSYPLDGNDNNDFPSKAEPDNTQDQIMKVMKNTSIEYARVLNLSDLRTPDSKALYVFIKSKEAKNINHSIFDKNRIRDFNSLFIKNVPVIYGWGVDSSLTDLAKQAVERINAPNPAGLKKENTNYAYYHPLPRIYNKQVEWVNKLSKMLTRQQCV